MAKEVKKEEIKKVEEPVKVVVKKDSKMKNNEGQ